MPWLSTEGAAHQLADGDTLVFDDPCLIVEVTSRWTRRIDRGEKLDGYLSLPSLRGYLIAEHDRQHVTFYSREVSGEWSREEVVGHDWFELFDDNPYVRADYMERMEETLGDAYSEPAGDVRGYIESVKG